MIKFLEQNSRRNLAETYPRGFCKRFLQEVSARGFCKRFPQEVCLGRRAVLAQTSQKPRRNLAETRQIKSAALGRDPYTTSCRNLVQKPRAETSCRNIPQKPRRNLCRNLLQKRSRSNLIIKITVYERIRGPKVLN